MQLPGNFVAIVIIIITILKCELSALLQFERRDGPRSIRCTVELPAYWKVPREPHKERKGFLKKEIQELCSERWTAVLSRWEEKRGSSGETSVHVHVVDKRYNDAGNVISVVLPFRHRWPKAAGPGRLSL